MRNSECNMVFLKPHRRNTGMICLCSTFLILMSMSGLYAQDVASGLVTADVITALTVIASSPLQFGDVYPGVAKTVDKNTVDAGVFDIIGYANADLMMYLSLPEFLATASGDDRMTISFGNTTLDIDTAIVGPGDPTAFVGGWQGEDPHNIMGVVGADPCLGDAGRAALYIGGKVTPSPNQTSGPYTGDILLTVAYKGT